MATDNVGVTKYNVYQNGILLGSTSADSKEYAVTGLNPSTSYQFAIEAEDLKANKTAEKITLQQSTAMAITAEGANFFFALTNLANENESVDTEVINIVTDNVLASNAVFNFTFDKELADGTYLSNLQLVKSSEPLSTLALTASDFSYAVVDGKGSLQLTIPVSVLTESGEYKLTLKSGLEAADAMTIGKDYTWKFFASAKDYGIIDVATGCNSYSSRNKPADRFYLAVKNDGTVWGWGNNAYGHLGDGTTQNATNPTQALGLANIVKVYAGCDSSFALDKDGSIYAWGSNEKGQLGRGTLLTGTSGRRGNNLPQKIDGLPPIAEMSYGFMKVVALDTNGEVWTWGFRCAGYQVPYGVLSTGTPVKVSKLPADIVSVEASYGYSLAVDSKGNVWQWSGIENEPVKLAGLSEIKSVSAYGNNYGNQNLALRIDGTVFMWGNATLRTVLAPGVSNRLAMDVMQVEGASGIKEVYAESLTMLTSDRQIQKIDASIYNDSSTAAAGEIWQGYNNISKFADFAQGGMIVDALADNFVSSGIFLQMDSTFNVFEKAVSKVATPDLSTKEKPIWPDSEITVSNLTEQAMTISWTAAGENIDGYALYQNGVLLTALPGTTLSYNLLGLTKNTSYSFKVEARYASSGYSDNGPSKTISTLDKWQPSMAHINKVAAGASHSLMIDSNGNVWAWGSNACGQLGDGTTTDSSVPVAVSGLSNITQVVCGDNHSAALDGLGNVWVWGDNSAYQLGNGTKVSNSTPVKLAGVSDIVNISAAANYNMAVKNDGSLWSWGSGTFCLSSIYVLATADGHTPVKMRYNTPNGVDGNLDFYNVKMVAASREFYSVLFADGTVSRVGYFYDSVGAKTYSHCAYSLNKTALLGVQAISAGDNFLMALLEDGTLDILGDNSQGQFSNGSRLNPTPATPCAYCKISGLSDVVAVEAGGSYGLALKADGSVWGWGQNNKGQLGNKNTVTQTQAVAMQTVTGVDNIAAGNLFSLAVLDNTAAAVSVYATGENSFGQLGTATTDNTNVPKVVMFGSVVDITPPNFPANFSISAFKDSDSSATIMWTDAVDDIGLTTYKLFDESDAEIASIAADTNEYQVTGLTAGVSKTYYIKAYDTKNNESVPSSTVNFDIATLAERPAIVDPFIAKIVNIADGDKDVDVATVFEIAFAEPITFNSYITENKAVILVIAGQITPVEADYQLSDDGKTLTVSPQVALAYGKDYVLSVTDKVKNTAQTLSAYPTKIDFSTRAFNNVLATATKNGDGVDISLKMTNLSTQNKDIVVKYVVRSGKGTRLESGGVVTCYGEKKQNAVLINIISTVNIAIADISKDLYGDTVSGNSYVDIYITNNNGTLLSDAIHIAVQ